MKSKSHLEKWGSIGLGLVCLILVVNLVFRGGFKTGPQDLGTLGWTSGVCLGLGFRLGNFALDYSFAPYGPLGSTHRLGFRTIFTPQGGATLTRHTGNARLTVSRASPTASFSITDANIDNSTCTCP